MHISRTQIEDSGLIEFHQAAKRYGGDGGAVALQPLDLSIGRGGVFGIIGQSGAGKSTLLRLINGLERPSSGRVFVDGHDLSALGDAQLRALRRRIGMVFQHFNLLSSQTVAQNVAFPLRLDAGNARAAIDARVAEALERVGLSAHASKYPAQLSGGQKQRVGIARALATRPDILLCDEATSALDPQTTASVLDLLQQLHRDLSLTVVLITHEMDVIRRICDHVAVLDAGHLVETGKVVDVFLEPQHPVTQRFLRESGHDAATDDTSRFADDPGCIVHLRVRGTTAHAPLLSAATRSFGTDIAWLDGRVGELRGVAFGDLTLSLRGGDVPGALAWLGTQGARIDVLREARP